MARLFSKQSSNLDSSFSSLAKKAAKGRQAPFGGGARTSQNKAQVFKSSPKLKSPEDVFKRSLGSSVRHSSFMKLNPVESSSFKKLCSPDKRHSIIKISQCDKFEF